MVILIPNKVPGEKERHETPSEKLTLTARCGNFHSKVFKTTTKLLHNFLVIHFNILFIWECMSLIYQLLQSMSIRFIDFASLGM